MAQAILLEKCMPWSIELCKDNLLGGVVAVVLYLLLIPAPQKVAGDSSHFQTFQELFKESRVAQNHPLFLCNL